MVLAIDRAPDWGWTAPATLALVAAGVILFAAFAFVETRAAAPVVEMALVRNRVFAWLGGVGAASNAAWALVIFCATLYLQQVRRLSVFEAGVLFLPLSVGASIGGPLAGRLARRFSARDLMAAGMLVSAGAMLLLTRSVSWTAYVVTFTVTGLGLGVAYAATNSGTLAAAPPQKAGAASGIVFTGLLIAAAFAVTLSASLVEEFSKALGEGIAIDRVLQLCAALAAGAGLLLLVAAPRMKSA